MIHIKNERGRSRCSAEKKTEVKGEDGVLRAVYTLPVGHELWGVDEADGSVFVCFDCRAFDIHIQGPTGFALCGINEQQRGWEILTKTALESGCNECRAQAGIGPTADKGCAVRPAVNYEQQPELLDREGKPYERDKT